MVRHVSPARTTSIQYAVIHPEPALLQLSYLFLPPSSKGLPFGWDVVHEPGVGTFYVE